MTSRQKKPGNRQGSPTAKEIKRGATSFRQKFACGVGKEEFREKNRATAKEASDYRYGSISSS